jgi:hypothetical protein
VKELAALFEVLVLEARGERPPAASLSGTERVIVRAPRSSGSESAGVRKEVTRESRSVGLSRNVPGR